MNKNNLRKHVSSIVKTLSSQEKKTQSSHVFKLLVEDPRFKKATRLFLYLGTENEIDTQPILRHALEFEKQCFIPYVDKTRSMRAPHDMTRMMMVRLYSMEMFELLEPNHYGIKEPKELPKNQDDIALPLDLSAPQSLTSFSNKASKPSFDLFLVPGVAFSKDGQRLGHGMGYYDEFLTCWNKRASAGSFFTIGLSFREQIIDDVLAVDGHDYKLDEVLFKPLA